MSMNIACPGCALNFPVMAGVNEADAKRFAGMMAEIHPDVAKVLFAYLDLFRPVKTGLRWSRALNITSELLPMIKAHQVKRNSVTSTAPAFIWINCMEEMINKRGALTLPLKSNGYLLEMVVAAAEKHNASHERKTEELRRSGHREEHKSLDDLKSELASVKRLFNHAINDASKQALQKQIDGLEMRIANCGR